MNDQFLETDDTDATDDGPSHVDIDSVIAEEDIDDDAPRRSRTSDGDIDASPGTPDPDEGDDEDADDEGADAAEPEVALDDPATTADSDAEDDVSGLNILPKQNDEFVCSSCFLVQHKSRQSPGSTRCRECE